MVAELARPIPNTMVARDWSQLFLLGFIWGGSFFFARVAVAEIQPLMLVLLRVGIAAVVLQFYLLLRGLSFRPVLSRTKAFLLLALLNNVIPFSLIFVGQTELGAGPASVLYATTPFWTVILANALTSDEKLSWNKTAGVLLGITGTAVMIGPSLLTDLGGPLWAKLALISAAISYALAVIFAKRFRDVPPVVVAAGQLSASTIIMIPLVLVSQGAAGLLSSSLPVWSAVVALAVLSTAFAFILYFNLIASAGATNASLVTLVVPVSAIFLGALFLGERFETFELAGIVLIGLGLVTIDGRAFRQ